MPEFETYIDIDPDEFIDNCSEREIGELIESLVESGYLTKTATTKPSCARQEEATSHFDRRLRRLLS